MPVFTALRNKAQSAAAGFVTKTARDVLGLNKAKGLRFPVVKPTPRPDGNLFNGSALQYPLDLGTTGNSHFIAFLIKKVTPPKIALGRDNAALKALRALKFQETRKLTSGTDPRNPKRDAAEVRARAKVEINKIREQRNKLIASQVEFANRQLSVNDLSGRSIREISAASISTVATIALHFPASIQQDYDLIYNEQQISRQAAFGAQVIQAFMAQGISFDALRASVDPVFDGVKSILNRLGISALDTIAPGAEALIGLNRGQVLAPKMEVMFEGIGKRKFQYTFVFTPDSLDEAEEVERIIFTFRKHAASNFADGTNFGFELEIPDMFEIQYYTEKGSPNGYLHKIGNCALESVSVTYGGDKMTFHETDSHGAPPTKTSMTLSFRELRTITRDAIEAGF
tara:strand:+ start:357 stop:1553 length:1197 start_codon:yes stop_codon:yes gene_type:complete